MTSVDKQINESTMEDPIEVVLCAIWLSDGMVCVEEEAQLLPGFVAWPGGLVGNEIIYC